MRQEGILIYSYDEFNEMVNEHVSAAADNYDFLTFSGISDGSSFLVESHDIEFQEITPSIQSKIDSVEFGHLDNTANLLVYLFWKEVVPPSHVLIAPL